MRQAHLEQLPPELQAAPREFDAWSQAQLLKEQDASTPSEPLYHYTGEKALKGILEQEKIWCFGHQHQKDRQEFEYSMEIARRVIRDLASSTDPLRRHFCACLMDLLDNNSITSTFEFYLFSLSRHADDPQQWREYGHQGRGFAIGFAPVLFAPTEINIKDQANENVHVGRVIYGDAATEARHPRPSGKSAVEVAPDNHPIYTLVGRAASAWAHLEHTLDLIIWDLIGLDPKRIACVTAQIIGATNRYRAIESLLSHRADRKLDKALEARQKAETKDVRSPGRAK
jgi:hypothetical protein